MKESTTTEDLHAQISHPKSAYPAAPCPIDDSINSLSEIERLQKAHALAKQGFAFASAYWMSILSDPKASSLFQSRASLMQGNLYFETLTRTHANLRPLDDREQLLMEYVLDTLLYTTCQEEAPLNDRISTLHLIHKIVHPNSGIVFNSKEERFLDLRNILRIHPAKTDSFWSQYLYDLGQHALKKIGYSSHYTKLAIETYGEAQLIPSLDPIIRSAYKFCEMISRTHDSNGLDSDRVEALSRDVIKGPSLPEHSERANAQLRVLLIERLMRARLAAPRNSDKDSNSKIKKVLLDLLQITRTARHPHALPYAHAEYVHLAVQAWYEDIPLNKDELNAILISFNYLFNCSNDQLDYLKAYNYANGLKALFILHEQKLGKTASASSSFISTFKKQFPLERVIQLFKGITEKNSDNNHYQLILMQNVLLAEAALEQASFTEAKDRLSQTLTLMKNVPEDLLPFRNAMLASTSKVILKLMNLKEYDLYAQFSLLEDFFDEHFPLHHLLYLRSVMLLCATQPSTRNNPPKEEQLLEWLVEILMLGDFLSIKTWVHESLEQVEKSALPSSLAAAPSFDASFSSAPPTLEKNSFKDEDRTALPRQQLMDTPPLDVMNLENAVENLSLENALGSPLPSKQLHASADEKKPHWSYDYKFKYLPEPKVTAMLTSHADYTMGTSSTSEDPKLARYRESARSILDRLKTCHGKIKDTEVFKVLNQLGYEVKDTLEQRLTWHRNHRSRGNKKGTVGSVVDMGRRSSLAYYVEDAIAQTSSALGAAAAAPRATTDSAHLSSSPKLSTSLVKKNHPKRK